MEGNKLGDMVSKVKAIEKRETTKINELNSLLHREDRKGTTRKEK
jgi:hypothetical protein